MEEKIKLLGKDFSLPMFITKVNNIFVMYYTAIMMNDEKRVAHFLSDEVYQNMKERIDMKIKKLMNKLNGLFNFFYKFI